jgi:hypothetical protein
VPAGLFKNSNLMTTNELQWSIRHGLLWVAGVALMASCIMEETIIGGEGPQERAEVKFHAGIGVETKVSNPEGDHWDLTDTIGVYMIRAGSTLADSVIREGAKNKPYIVDSGDGTNKAAFVTAGDTTYYPNGENVNFVAYYPYSDSRVTADFKYRMDISDQSVPARLDLLYSNDKSVYNSRNHDATLPFDHLMTRVVFDALRTGTSNASLSGLQLEVGNVNTSTEFDLADGAPTLDGAGQSTIIPLKRYASDDSVRMEATLIPMADASGVQLLFLLNNKTYNATLPQTATGAALEKGKRYTYKVLFDEAEIKLEGELSAWGEEPGDTITPTPGSPDPNPSLPSVHVAGYHGQATVNFASGGSEVLTLNGNGKAGLTAQSSELIRSITLDDATNNAPILIGRKVEDALPLPLKVDGTGKPILRDEVNGYIPIGSYAEFQLINETANLSKKYKQETALDLMSEDWRVIGGFTGEYDGGEYEITNLKIEGTTNGVGLFGGVNNATLRNIRLVSGTVSGGDYVGGICGMAADGSSIINCYSGVSVTGKVHNTGGITGAAVNATVTFCRNTGNVRGVGDVVYNIGGIAGFITGISHVKYCDNSGEIEGQKVGGIVGFALDCTAEITACRNSGALKSVGNGLSGGIVGHINPDAALTVTACYNTGALDNNDIGYTGGIIGVLNNTASTITGCYSTGTVTGSNQDLIGLIGGSNEGGTITSCYWTVGSSTATKGVANNAEGTEDTKEFSETAWPTTSESGWGIGDGSGANTYWKSLGGWNGGAPEYPSLWWE